MSLGPIICLICIVCGILGNLLNFVITVFSLCFRNLWFEGEEHGMIAMHTPHCSAFYMTLIVLGCLLRHSFFTMVL